MTHAASTLNSLQDIDDVQPLDASDEAMIDEIVTVLRKYNALDRFGLSLLHKHFTISDDEVLMETTDVAERTQLIRPVQKSELEGLTYMETAWRLDSGKAVMGCNCVTDSGTGHRHQHTRFSSDALHHAFDGVFLNGNRVSEAN